MIMRGSVALDGLSRRSSRSVDLKEGVFASKARCVTKLSLGIVCR